MLVVQMLLDVAQDREDTIPALIYEARAVVSHPVSLGSDWESAAHLHTACLSASARPLQSKLCSLQSTFWVNAIEEKTARCLVPGSW